MTVCCNALWQCQFGTLVWPRLASVKCGRRWTGCFTGPRANCLCASRVMSRPSPHPVAGRGDGPPSHRPLGRREAYENRWCIYLFGETCWPPEVSSRLSEIVSVLPQDFSGMFLIRLVDCIFRSRLETERDARFAARADPRNLPYFVHAGSGKCCRPCGCA